MITRSEPDTSAQSAQLDIVIVNWNTGECLRRCLESVAKAAARVALGTVVVVDNASTDGSANLSQSPLPVAVMRNSENVGFAAACNQGAAGGNADLLLFLNPDTVLEPHTLRAGIEAMAAAAVPPRGICGGYLVGHDGAPTFSASHFPTLANVVLGTLHLDRVLPGATPRHLSARELVHSRTVDQVIGAFFLVRRSLYEELDGFDERFFLYYEEVDFSVRAASLGWTSYVDRKVTLQHIGNVSARNSHGLALYHSLRSRSVYASRHWPPWQASVLDAFTIAVELPVRLLRAIAAGSPAEIGEVLRAGTNYIRFLLSER